MSAPAQDRVQTVKDAQWFTPAFGTADGYGNSCEQMVLALERVGISITLAGSVLACGHQNAEEVMKRKPVFSDTIVFYSQPPTWSDQGTVRSKSIGFTMYESDVLPPRWYNSMLNVREIWVPSKFNVEVFSKFMPQRPVSLVPLGVDPVAFFARKRVRGPKLRFLMFATLASEVRKGPDLAINAFKAAFAGREDVELVIRSTKPHNIQKDDPRIKFDWGFSTTAQLSEYYGQFDAMVFPSRGEGFGLIPLEAMATGMPTIYPNSSGMAEYAEFGLTVSTHTTEAWHGQGRGEDHQRYGHWFEPNLDELAQRMRQVDQHYDECMTSAMRDAEKIATQWTWDRTARVIQAKLEGWPEYGNADNTGHVSKSRRVSRAS